MWYQSVGEGGSGLRCTGLALRRFGNVRPGGADVLRERAEGKRRVRARVRRRNSGDVGGIVCG